jgi:solute:Na+ symporter, SSS family
MSAAPLFASSGAESLLHMGSVDYVIVVIYFLIVLGIGFYLKKFVHTGEEFFMAGRRMTAWICGLSFISANLSSLETMGWSAMAYQYGMLGAHAYFISGGLPILFLAVVMMPFYYISKTHSVPGYLKLRYGEGSRILAGFSFAAMTVLVSGASMFAMADILHLLLGWNMGVSIWVASLTVAVYVTLGGLISAVFNEVLQFFLIWFGTLLIPILGLMAAGGWSHMMDLIQQHAKVIHPTMQNANFTSLWSNLGSFDTNPMGIDWFGMVFGQGLAIGFAYWCTDFLQVQRVIVAKDLRAAQNGTIIGSMLKMCVPLIVTIPGLLGLAVLLNPDGSPMVLVSQTDARATITHHTFNDVLPLLMGKYLGPGLLGLGVTAMIAGFMSGMAGNVSAFATVWTYDVYRPLIRKNASDAHYVNMGRWCSLIGVLLSIGTAYLLFLFSNILEFLQVLLFFFIVPLFGVVIVGMLWKRATRAGGFWGFLIAMLCSITMWTYVHTFPNGYSPQPQVNICKVTDPSTGKEKDTVVRREKATEAQPDTVIVENGAVETLNVPIPQDALRKPDKPGEPFIVVREISLPAAVATKNDEATTKEKMEKVRVIAKEVVLADTEKIDKFGEDGMAVVLRPGVEIKSSDVTQHFAPKAYNRLHLKIIARSEKAQPMAFNVYSAIWTLLISIVVCIGVSLFTTPKPDSELTGLVMGLTPRPDEGVCPWYRRPMLWGTVVFAIFVIVNIIFW